MRVDAKAGAFELCAQLAARVSADFSAQHRVVAFQHVHRGDIDDERRLPAAAPGTSRRSPLPLHGVSRQYSTSNDTTTSIDEAGKRQRGDAALRQPRQSAFVPELQSAPVKLEAEWRAVSDEERSGSRRCRIRRPEAGPRDACGRLLEQRRDESSEAAKPEVPLFGIESPFEQCVHCAHSNRPVAAHAADTRQTSRKRLR